MNNTSKLYAFDLCGAYPLTNGRMLVRNPRNGRHAILTPEVHAALVFCRKFHTLEDHAQRITQASPALQGQEAEVLNMLETVRDDGLMVSADIYSVTLQPSADPLFNLDKPVAAIITWERPDALQRCLESLRANCNTDNLARIVVIDDSRDEAVQRRNRQSTETFAAKIDTPVQHFGAEEQQEFMAAIIRQVPAIEAQVRFLIDRERWADHWTSGLARTLALLLSVGQRLIVLDDDILCEAFEADVSPGASFGDDARETRFYRSRDDVREQPVREVPDPLIRHMRTLGSGLKDALGALGARTLTAEAFEGADLEMLERLHGDSRVLVTECGTLGHPGTSNLNWLASLEGESLASMLKDDDSVDNAFSSRVCFNGAHRARLKPRSNMSQLTGLDNRALLPPYIPILRGEDRLFGDMLEFIHPASVVVDQPWAIVHEPLPPRQWNEREQQFQTGRNFEGLGLRRVEENMGSSKAREPLKRLSHLARLYEDLADMDDELLRKAATDSRLGAQAADYRMLKEALEQAGEAAPERWRQFLQAGVDKLNRELINNPPDVNITGYPPDLQDEALIQWWREFWTEFARALRMWPAIRQAARQVKTPQ